MRISDWSSDVCSSDLEFSAGHRRGPGPVHDHFQVFEIASGQVRGIDDTRSGDDRSAVLVIVEYGNVHTLAQRLLDDEAFWCLDVFKVDAAETRLQQFHRGNEAFDIFGCKLEVDGIDVGQADRKSTRLNSSH